MIVILWICFAIVLSGILAIVAIEYAGYREMKSRPHGKDD